MNRWLFFIPVVFAIILGVVFVPALKLENKEDIPTPLKGKPLPVFSLPTVKDPQKILSNTTMVGKPFLLNVWATWCITCKVEHPMLNKLSKQGVRIIGMDYKDSRESALKWFETYGNPYEVNIYDEDGTLGFDLGVTGAPETFFIRSDGTIAYRHVGEINDVVWNDKLKAIYETL
ncbi:DsbE family thiol:disulfide interchange protein [Gynuella sp.]|uniref:DsbE family thiol:disulfide interchange protein n=1 Tax=Gynuella sp. TaxID=2969146 RepID=UPI003D1054D1